jgi:hypothetical protein
MCAAPAAGWVGGAWQSAAFDCVARDNTIRHGIILPAVTQRVTFSANAIEWRQGPSTRASYRRACCLRLFTYPPAPERVVLPPAGLPLVSATSSQVWLVAPTALLPHLVAILEAVLRATPPCPITAQAIAALVRQVGLDLLRPTLEPPTPAAGSQAVAAWRMIASLAVSAAKAAGVVQEAVAAAGPPPPELDSAVAAAYYSRMAAAFELHSSYLAIGVVVMQGAWWIRRATDRSSSTSSGCTQPQAAHLNHLVGLPMLLYSSGQRLAWAGCWPAPREHPPQRRRRAGARGQQDAALAALSGASPCSKQLSLARLGAAAEALAAHSSRANPLQRALGLLAVGPQRSPSCKPLPPLPPFVWGAGPMGLQLAGLRRRLCAAADACRPQVPQLVGCGWVGCRNLAGPCEGGLVEGKKGVRCGGCGLARYCCLGCQRRDWPRHDRVCCKIRALARAGQPLVLIGQPGTSSSTW